MYGTNAWDELSGDTNDYGAPMPDDEGGEVRGEPTATVEPEPSAAASPAEEVPENAEPESQEPDYSWLSEDLRPAEFSNEAEALESFKGAYNKLLEKVQDGSFAEIIVKQYEERLAETDQTIAQRKEEFLAFLADPEGFARLHLPQLAEQAGIPAIPSEDQINDSINMVMAMKYGENWQEVYDDADKFRLGSVSHKIAADYNLALQHTNQFLTEAQQKRQQMLQEMRTKQPQQQNTPQVLTEEETNAILEKEFKVFEQNGVSREEYQRFVENAKGAELTIYDIYRAQNFDKLIDDAKKQAYEEGRRSLQGDLKKAGKLKPVQPDEITPRKASSEEKPWSKDDYYREQEASIFGL